MSYSKDNKIDEFIQTISNEHTIDAVFGNLNKFKKVGNTYIACCPFHTDNNPSFSINIENGVILFHCFGCGESGNVLQYIARINQLNLRVQQDLFRATEILSQITGIPIPENTFTNKEKTKEQIEFDTYHSQLINDDDTVKHLSERGIKDLSIFGYDNGTYKILSRHLNSYAIIDYNPDDKPKYNFPRGFKKDIPFNLSRCSVSGDLYITEGIFDALILQEYFNLNSCAILGSSLNKATIKHIRRYNNIILCLDNDEAGRIGTQKAIDLLYRNGQNKVFFINYQGFDYKDINDAYKAQKLNDIEQLINNNLQGYTYLISEHFKQLDKLQGELNRIKIIDAFIKQIASYPEMIQNKLLNEYTKAIGIDIRDELKLYKSQLAVSEYKINIETLINDNMNLEDIEQIQSLTNETVSRTAEVQIYNLSDLAGMEHNTGIQSLLIQDIRYYEGALSFIGAKTGHGKTTFMINEAINFAMENKVAFISLEESFKWIGGKLFVSHYNRHIDPERPITLKDFYSNKQHFIDFYREFEHNLSVIDRGQSIEQIEKYILYLHNHMDVNIFFLDYIQRITVTGKMSKLSRQEQIKYINTILLELIKKYELIFISGSQFNRTITSKTGINSTNVYREAGDIEQDANLIINLWNCKNDSDNPDPNKLEYYISKNRNGRSGISGYLEIEPEYWIIHQETRQ
jgi:DNA primase